jgi:hypothetical protein
MEHVFMFIRIEHESKILGETSRANSPEQNKKKSSHQYMPANT